MTDEQVMGIGAARIMWFMVALLRGNHKLIRKEMAGKYMNQI
jgi:hypothetical protein